MADLGLLGEVAMVRQDSGKLTRFASIFAEQVHAQHVHFSVVHVHMSMCICAYVHMRASG